MTRKGRKSQSRREISNFPLLDNPPLETTKHRGELRLPPIGCTPRGLRLLRPTIEVTSGSGATPRHPPTQAAKKCGIEPQLVPVPPAESPVDGAGAQWGRKDGPPDSYLEPLNPHESPFFFGFQKPFFFQQGKRNGFCRPRKVRTVQNALSGISHSAPLLVLSPRDPLRWARAGTPFLHVVWRVPQNQVVAWARLGSRAPQRKVIGKSE